MVTFNATFSDGPQFNASLTESQTLSASFGVVEVIHDTDWYDGPYEATPSSDEQVFHTAMLSMVNDFVIKPIPSNYGLISWNGSILTVS